MVEINFAAFRLIKIVTNKINKKFIAVVGEIAGIFRIRISKTGNNEIPVFIQETNFNIFDICSLKILFNIF
jgi:hypothetical protein